MTSLPDDRDAPLNRVARRLRAGEECDAADAEALTSWARYAASEAARKSTLPMDWEETVADAVVWTVEQLRDYRDDDDQGSAFGYLHSRLDWFTSQTRREQSGITNKNWWKIVGVLSAVLERHQSRGEALPSIATLREEVRAEVLTQMTATIRKDKPDITAAELDEHVLARMSKDGLSRAFEEFHLIVAAAAGPIRLDQPVSDDDSTVTFGATLPAPEPDGDAAEQRLDELARVMLGDATWARQAVAVRAGSDVEGSSEASSLEKLAAETGHSAAELKTVVTLARSRVSAAHAQWAHLAPRIQITAATPESLFADA